jgi:demethylmenaquinone methyltransferase / 2-methoxy-6-polyprenyl-1,4-benzoquinol methylase
MDVLAAPSPRKQHALALFSGLPRRYDAMGAALSFGQDPRWRRALVAAIDVGPDATVLDVATGTGLVAAALVRHARCRVVGLDQSAQMLEGARARLAADPQLRERIELVQGTAERLPFDDGAFHALTFTYLLRYVDDPAATLRELARVVKPGGAWACRRLGRSYRATGSRWGGSSGRASKTSTAVTRSCAWCGRGGTRASARCASGA